MKKQTGIVIPIAALYTKDCAQCGDFLALKEFGDFCKKSGITMIQLLPVNDTGTHSSPYSGLSAYALHPLYIRLEAIPEFKECYDHNKAFATAYRLFKKDFEYSPRFNYEKLLQAKTNLLHLLFDWTEKSFTKKTKAPVNEVTITDKATQKEQFYLALEKFAKENPWVIQYSVFKNLKDSAMQASWKQWDENLQNLNRDQIMLRWNNKALKSSHNFFVWCQLNADRQFSQSTEYLRSLGIMLKGDIPILMNEDSVDCWAYPEYFNQELRAGSPPDGDNPMGQNWGFPTYNWPNIEKDDFAWWKNRVRLSSKYYDAFRIDHILGFFRIWAASTRETTAYLGHTEPCARITRRQLNDLGFNDDRIRWMSKPHVPTGFIENITWNHDEAVAVLEQVADRIGNEELWIYKDSILGDRDFYNFKFFEDNNKDYAVKDALCQKWRDRSFIQETEDSFIPAACWQNSTAYSTLSDQEKNDLGQLIGTIHSQENELFREQAIKVLTPIVNETNMIPCAEDLGVDLACMPDVLNSLGILSLKVVRWNRRWNWDGQPYFKWDEYPELSVSTTSVHDSSTLRQWWNDEKSSVQAFLSMTGAQLNMYDQFNPDIAKEVLSQCAKCASALWINPLQDYLYTCGKYYLENPNDERINVPGSVNEFNWTYRIPCTVEDLIEDSELISNIKNLSEIHQK